MNMRKLTTSFLLVCCALLASQLTAKAGPVTIVNGGGSATFFYQANGFPNSNAMATFSLTGNILTIQLSNTSTEGGNGTWVNGIGFNTTPNVTVSNYQGTGVAANWTLNSGTGPLSNFEVYATDGQAFTIQQGGTETLTFTLQGFSGNLTIDLTRVNLINLGPGDGGSQAPEGKLVSTPEPTSIALLVTGLAGAVGAVRRRRKARALEA